MLLLPPFPTEPQGQGPDAIVTDALPMWQEEDELPDHRQYIFHYHTMMCPQFAQGFCPRHKGSRSAPLQCFCYHFESQRRRPLVDTFTGQLRYWDVLCEHVAEGKECPYGDMCAFAHTREEISYHAAKYKTKFCNDRDCRGQEVCCFAHGDSELRTHALEMYSYWSLFGGGANGGMLMQAPFMNMPPPSQWPATSKVYKHRFCASYPNVSSCRRGDACAFAHSREEIRTPLLADDEENQRQTALNNEFFMYRFKTLWCPVGVQHDWQSCVYAHNYQDARRHPGINYGPRPCPYWKRKDTALEYSQRCPLGVRCPFSHGAKEQLYHPAYFKTVTCQDWPGSNNCPRGKLCAFWHKRSQQRPRGNSEDEFNYKQPISESRLQEALQPDFLSPPFKLLNSLQGDTQGLPNLADGTTSEIGQSDFCGATGVSTVPESMCQQQFGHWGTTTDCTIYPADTGLCSFGGVGTPATMSTAADSDEAAAESLAGSDKSAVIHEEEGSPAGGLLMNPAGGQGHLMGLQPFACTGPASSVMNAQATGLWPGDAMPMTQSFGPVSGNCGMTAPVMCYVQMQPAPVGHSPSAEMPQMLADSSMVSQQVQMTGLLKILTESIEEVPSMPAAQLLPDAGNGSPMNGNVIQMPGFPSGPFPQVIQDGFNGPQGPLCTAGACEVMQPGTCMVFCGAPPSGAASGNFSFLPCGGAFPPGAIMMPPMMDGMRLVDVTMPEMSVAPAPSGITNSTGGEDGQVIHEEAMPTYNGFIHFKETDAESESDIQPKGRPRSASH